jgi:hypothetical protein
MKVCNVNRNAFYAVLDAIFAHIKIVPSIVELGVLRGDNASAMLAALKPEKLVLIDAWSASAMQGAFHPFDQTPPWIAPMTLLEPYYGGALHEQVTFDRIFEQCVARFAGNDKVEIIRGDTVGVLEQFGSAGRNEDFNIVYVDANHRYEHVLRELLYWKDRVAVNGALVLNDCCHSAGAVQLNFGVLPALTEFIKRTDFIPVLLTNTDWSDVVLVRKDSLMEKLVDQVVTNSDIAFVDIPHQLLGAVRIVPGTQRCNVSFV